MPRPYSNDLRARVIEAIEAGASRREVAERYELSASVVVLWALALSKPEALRQSQVAQHLTVGGTRRLSADSDCQAAGFDAGRDRCGDGQTRDLGQPQRGLAVLRATQHQLQKKLCTQQSNSARKWPARVGVGCESKACLTRPDWSLSTRPARPPAWCGCEGRCLRGERLIGYARHGQWKTITLMAGLRHRAMVAPSCSKGPSMDRRFSLT